MEGCVLLLVAALRHLSKVVVASFMVVVSFVAVAFVAVAFVVAWLSLLLPSPAHAISDILAPINNICVPLACIEFDQ